MESKIKKVEAQLDDITECSICAETFKEPKILSCIHTFCKNCLLKLATKLEKSSGDEVPCPICRKRFLVPEVGFDGLQRNFFMEKLIEMKNFCKSSSTKNVCEVCLEEARAEAEDGNSPFAEVYCCDCQQKLCKECHKCHLKIKATKNHKIFELNEKEEIKVIIPGFCEIHPSQQLNVYCNNCTSAVCMLCFLENHKSHNGSSIESVVDDFQKQIQKNVDTLSVFIPFLEERKEKLEKEKAEFIVTLDELETEIARSREKLWASIEVHFESLLSEANNRRKVALKSMESRKDDINTLLISLESFKVYCNEIISKGSATSICTSVGSLNSRAAELKTQYDDQVQHDFTYPRLQLTKLIHVEGRNLVGVIEEINMENGSDTPKEDVERAADMDNEEPDDKKVSITDNITNLEATERELIDKVKDLEQQVSLLQYIVNNKENTESPSGSLDYNAGVTSTSSLFSISESWIYWSAMGLTIIGDELFLCTRADKMIVEIYDLGTFSFKRRWTIPSGSTVKDFKGCKTNNCLYFMLYSENGFSINMQWASSNGEERKCDEKVPTCIYRYSSTGELITYWPVDDSDGQISVTEEGNVLVTRWNKSELQEYTPDGQLILTIQLQWNVGFQSLKHAIKLNSRHYLVSHGDGSELMRRICMIDCNGKIINCYDKTGVKDPMERLKCLVTMVKDSRGNILVVDSGYCRLIVLGKDLKSINEGIFIREKDADLKPVNKQQCVSDQERRCIMARNIVIDEKHGRIFGINQDHIRGYARHYVTVFTLGSD